MYKLFAQSTDQAQPAHILLVDRDSDGLRPLVEALRGAGHRVSFVFDGEQGYNRAVSLLPDLIITEVNLPGLDGYALCRWLKAGLSTAHIPVIFLSSAAKMRDKLAGLRCGAVDYVTKPYEAEELVARVGIHLRLAGARAADSDGPEEAQEDAGLLLGHPDGAAPMQGVGGGADEVLVRAARRELLANLSITPSLAGIAECMGVNPRRLSRAFRRCLGITLFDYLRQERMRVACRLLCQTSLSVAAIATELGYSSAANFSTAFRASVGQSPSAYRQLPKKHKASDMETNDFM